MSPPTVKKLAHSQPLVTVLILAVFVTSSCQRHDKGSRRSSNITSKENEIDGFLLSNCGWFKPREWHELEHAFGCNQSESRLSESYKKTSAKGLITRQESGTCTNDISIKEFPFYAHLAIKSADVDTECAGTLVDYEFVVTTARCAYAATRIFIILGTSSTEATQGWNTEADKWCFPKKYHPIDNPYIDVAVLRLKVRANYSDAIRPACLPQDMQPSKQASCMVARKRTNQLARKMQGYVVKEQKCPENLPELYEANCYQANDKKVGFCRAELGTPVVCYDTCEKDSGRVQGFAVGMESFAPTPGDKCNPDQSVPIQYTDLSRISRLIRTMTHTLIDATEFPTPSTIKCVEPKDSYCCPRQQVTTTVT